jgi:hypothetical protein
VIADDRRWENLVGGEKIKSLEMISPEEYSNVFYLEMNEGID